MSLVKKALQFSEDGAEKTQEKYKKKKLKKYHSCTLNAAYVTTSCHFHGRYACRIPGNFFFSSHCPRHPAETWTPGPELRRRTAAPVPPPSNRSADLPVSIHSRFSPLSIVRIATYAHACSFKIVFSPALRRYDWKKYVTTKLLVFFFHFSCM